MANKNKTLKLIPTTGKITEKTWIIVGGWIHPKGGGDDYPFRRGFVLDTKHTWGII